jgi:hypothetical protein
MKKIVFFLLFFALFGVAQATSTDGNYVMVACDITGSGESTLTDANYIAYSSIGEISQQFISDANYNAAVGLYGSPSKGAPAEIIIPPVIPPGGGGGIPIRPIDFNFIVEASYSIVRKQITLNIFTDVNFLHDLTLTIFKLDGNFLFFGKEYFERRQFGEYFIILEEKDFFDGNVLLVEGTYRNKTKERRLLVSDIVFGERGEPFSLISWVIMLIGGDVVIYCFTIGSFKICITKLLLFLAFVICIIAIFANKKVKKYRKTKKEKEVTKKQTEAEAGLLSL